MKISPEKRQEILHFAGKTTADLLDLLNKYPIGALWLMKKPEVLLPYSKELIIQAIDEELDDPMVGTLVRGKKSTKEWCENLETFRLVILNDFLPAEQWLQEYQKTGKMMREHLEKTYLAKNKS